jgi:hypothetical protein
MKIRNLLLAVALAWGLLGGIAVSAAQITAFSATADQNTPFTIVLNTMFTSTLARITNSSVACNQTTTCSGEVATYSLTLTGLIAPTPVMGTLDGMLSGIGTASGTVSVAVNGIPVSVAPFSVDVGPFFKTLFSTQIPTTFGNTVALTGSLNLTLPPGDSVVLPTSLDFAIAQVPEPASVSLVGCGLLGLASFARLLGCRRS